VQPLWKPAQPQSEQRKLIPSDSFFLPRLFGSTIVSESHSWQRSILAGLKVLSRILNGLATTWMTESIVSRREEAGFKQQIDKLGETLRRGKRKYQITKA
jgi:hypothetical protein